VWWSVSCCGDSDVDDVSKGNGGGFQERRKRGRKKKRHLDMRIAMCRKESVLSRSTHAVQGDTHLADARSHLLREGQRVEICVGDKLGIHQ